MNVLKKIKAGLAISRAYDNIEEAYKMNPIKPGWKTTEFWMTVAANAITLIGALKGIIPEQYATTAVAVSTAVYTICRTWHKNPAAPVDESVGSVTTNVTQK